MPALNLGAVSNRRFENGLIHELTRILSIINLRYFDRNTKRFDYVGFIKSADYSHFQLTVRQFQSFDPANLHGYSDQLAFWLNAYNAMVIHGVAEEIKNGQSHLSKNISIRDFDGFYSNTAYQFGRFQLSLDDIEHGILRANARRTFGRHFSRDHPAQQLVFGKVEPRIHMALYSACNSSPNLNVFRTEELEPQLQRITVEYLKHYVSSGKRLVLPRIFQWYATDFDVVGGVMGFVAANHPDRKLSQILLKEKVVPVFSTFDWHLNQKVESASNISNVVYE